MNLIVELQNKRELLNKALSECVKRGKELAQAECEYKQSAAKFILAQRAMGTPATLIRELALGDDIVSKLRLNRDIASVYYDNAKEARNVYKLEARLIEEQIKREWGQAE